MELLVETNFNTTTQLVESAGKKSWFIEGICLQADIVNQNKRRYPLGVMSEAVDNFKNTWMARNQGVGELNHPQTPEVNPERVAIKIESLSQDNKNFLTKAKVLGTPQGKIVEALLEGGVKLGLSSRGLGAVKPGDDGINEVQNGYRISAIDVVYYPSAPDAFVQGIMENKEIIWNTSEEDMKYLESLKESIKRTKSKNLQEAQMNALESYLKRLGSIRVV